MHGGYCLGIFQNRKDPSTLLRGIVVRNTFVTYDREHGKIGLWKTNCSELWKRLNATGSPPPAATPDEASTLDRPKSSAALPPAATPTGASPYIILVNSGVGKGTYCCWSLRWPYVDQKIGLIQNGSTKSLFYTHSKESLKNLSYILIKPCEIDAETFVGVHATTSTICLPQYHMPRSSEQTPPRRGHSDLFDSLQSLKLQSPNQKVSPAMHSLQDYYNLTSPDEKTGSKGCEMVVYQKGGSHYLEDGPFGKPLPSMNPPLSVHRKSKSITSDFKLENGVLGDDISVPASDNWSGNLARRRQKSEADFSSCAPEKLLKEDASSNGFSIFAGKGLALRTKAASRTVSGANGETLGQYSVSTAVGDFSLIHSSSGVKKSYSTPSLQEADNSSSIWPTVNWGLKPDFQALSTATAIRPIFDGLPKPVTSRRNKTAVD